MSSEYQSNSAANSSTDKKPNIFQKMFKKLDDKMKAKADESASCCCCSEEKKTTEESDKCC